MTIQTLGIIKPDAVNRHLENVILQRLNSECLTVKKIKKLKLNKQIAEKLYIEHKDKPFYQSLINYITSGDIIVMLIEGNDAINKWRDIIGNTDPQKAKPGTIRRQYALNKTQNSVHGSASLEEALREINLFFSKN